MAKNKTTPEEKRIGRKLLKELDDLLSPDMSGNYVAFDSPRKDLWLAFRERWGAVVHLRSPRVRKASV